MVTFVPGFVSQKCADWLDGLKAEAAHRGLDPRDVGQLFSLKAEWERAHPRPGPRSRRSPTTSTTSAQVAGVDHVGLGGDFDGI